MIDIIFGELLDQLTSHFYTKYVDSSNEPKRSRAEMSRTKVDLKLLREYADSRTTNMLMRKTKERITLYGKSKERLERFGEIIVFDSELAQTVREGVKAPLTRGIGKLGVNAVRHYINRRYV